MKKIKNWIGEKGQRSLDIFEIQMRAKLAKNIEIKNKRKIKSRGRRNFFLGFF